MESKDDISDAKEEQPRQEKPFGIYAWMEKWTAAEQEATKTFFRALIANLHQYIDMTEEDVVEEYRRAGKLHTSVMPVSPGLTPRPLASWPVYLSWNDTSNSLIRMMNKITSSSLMRIMNKIRNPTPVTLANSGHRLLLLLVRAAAACASVIVGSGHRLCRREAPPDRSEKVPPTERGATWAADGDGSGRGRRRRDESGGRGRPWRRRASAAANRVVGGGRCA
uniref:Uncharacterized protein n=1 Tax=Oryza punctata TaxID=4537 RepID=A0A0E0JFD3_ORYPU